MSRGANAASALGRGLAYLENHYGKTAVVTGLVVVLGAGGAAALAWDKTQDDIAAVQTMQSDAATKLEAHTKAEAARHEAQQTELHELRAAQRAQETNAYVSCLFAKARDPELAPYDCTKPSTR